MPSLENFASIALASASLVVGAAVVHREVVGARAAPAAPQAVEYEPNWKSALPIGYRIGSDSSPITLVELFDLECPACGRYQATVHQLLKEHPKEVSVVYVPYPLQSLHRFAMGAARAAECANDVGRAGEWINAVFDAQDSLGLIPWSKFARYAGIADTEMIVRCATASKPVARIQEGIAFAKAIHARGTPTILLNGWRFPDPPYLESLDSAIVALRRGQAPPQAARGRG